ncbi:MAG: DUF2029 domain-containing protein [Acidimicrobiales bacterium]|nr:DUF2029 domain-containing protein [Acidimicrobiales bacterium]
MTDPPESRHSRGAGSTSPRPSPSLWRRGFVALLCFWLVVPLLLKGEFAQDALPFVVAGDLAERDPASVYSVPERSIFDVNENFRARLCNELVPDEPTCHRLAVPFVSTPLVLPLARLAAALGADGGSLLLRLLAAVSLAGGMELLWRKRAASWSGAQPVMFLLAFMITPYAVFTLAFGQTSPWMFAAACAGLGGRDRRFTVLAAGLWVANIAARGFPALLVALPVRLRHWRPVGYAAVWGAAVVAVAALTIPGETIQPFIASSRTLANHSYGNPYNVSFANLLHTFIPSLGPGALVGAGIVGAFAIAVGSWLGPVARLDADAQWATAWLVLLVAVPLVWWHYGWLMIPPLVLALGPGTPQRAWAVVVCAVGGLTSLLAGVNGTAGGQIVQSLALLLAIAAVVWLSTHAGQSRAQLAS